MQIRMRYPRYRISFNLLITQPRYRIFIASAYSSPPLGLLIYLYHIDEIHHISESTSPRHECRQSLGTIASLRSVHASELRIFMFPQELLIVVLNQFAGLRLVLLPFHFVVSPVPLHIILPVLRLDWLRSSTHRSINISAFRELRVRSSILSENHSVIIRQIYRLTIAGKSLLYQQTALMRVLLEFSIIV